MSKKALSGFLAIVLIGVLGVVFARGGSGLTPQEELGKKLFFDTNLSEPRGQSCAACHAPEVGWTGPDIAINVAGAVYEGAVPGKFGNRKPPASAYAGDSPVLQFDKERGLWVGGMFWDGRATGMTLGDPLAEQAQGPFLNPREQNNPSAYVVVDKVMKSSYKDLFLSVCGADNQEYYNCIGRAIAAYERSTEVSPFTSKYDYWLEGEAKLTGQEMRGLELFRGKGKCAICHVEPLFTDFTYDNIGVPRNPQNPFYEDNPDGSSWVDPGLGGYLESAGYSSEIFGPEWGKHKVPTLRNVDQRPFKQFTKAYGHNGYFKSLEEIVEFYNTRDNPRAGWPPPEVPQNVNRTEVGNLGLNHGEVMAIVAFMRTLSDGWAPDNGKPGRMTGCPESWKAGGIPSIPGPKARK